MPRSHPAHRNVLCGKDLDDRFSEKEAQMKKFIAALSVLAISFIVSACSDKGNSAALFAVEGVVSGLTGTLTLQNNGGDDLTVTTNGPFTFPTAMTPGSSYIVTVGTNPTGKTCVVSNGTGTILISNVTNVSVDCIERGGLDVTFNSPNGFAVQNNAAGSNGDDSGKAIAVDSQGRMLVAGSSTNSAGNTDMALWRFNANGTLDTTFNGSGIVVHNSAAGGAGDDSGKAIAVDSQGRILVAGSSTNSAGNKDMVIWRFNVNGTLDTTFNGSGTIVNNGAAGGVGDDSGNAIALDSQGRILVAGSSTNSAGNNDMVVWRFNANGTVDTGFNKSGIVVNIDVAGGVGDDSGNAIVVDSQGRILVAGSSTDSSGNKDMVVWRYKTDGTIDTTFNTTGIVINNGAAGGSGDDFGNAIAVDSQGRILVAGSSTNISGNTDMVIWRFKADGTLDTTFNNSGIVINNGAAGSNGNDSGNAIAIDFQGGILLTGSSTNTAGNTDMVVWKFNADGTLDTTFNNSGIVINNGAAGGNGNDSGNALAIDSQARILITGSSTNGAGNTDMVIWRVLP